MCLVRMLPWLVHYKVRVCLYPSDRKMSAIRFIRKVITGLALAITFLLASLLAWGAATQRLVDPDIESFVSKRDSILVSVEALVEAQDWERAFSYARQWQNEADQALLRMQVRAREHILLNKLKALGEVSSECALQYLEELRSMFPHNKHYQDAFEFHEAWNRDWVAVKRAAVWRARVERFGVPPVIRYADSYEVVEDYLQHTVYSPQSIRVEKCTKDPVYKEEGWLVGCIYWYRNRLGEHKQQANWFIVQHERVISMHAVDVYSLKSQR